MSRTGIPFHETLREELRTKLDLYLRDSDSGNVHKKGAKNDHLVTAIARLRIVLSLSAIDNSTATITALKSLSRGGDIVLTAAIQRLGACHRASDKCGSGLLEAYILWADELPQSSAKALAVEGLNALLPTDCPGAESVLHDLAAKPESVGRALQSLLHWARTMSLEDPKFADVKLRIHGLVAAVTYLQHVHNEAEDHNEMLVWTHRLQVALQERSVSLYELSAQSLINVSKIGALNTSSCGVVPQDFPDVPTSVNV